MSTRSRYCTMLRHDACPGVQGRWQSPCTCNCHLADEPEPCLHRKLRLEIDFKGTSSEYRIVCKECFEATTSMPSGLTALIDWRSRRKANSFIFV